MNIQREKLFKEGRRACFGSQCQGTVHHGEAVTGTADSMHCTSTGRREHAPLAFSYSCGLGLDAICTSNCIFPFLVTQSRQSLTIMPRGLSCLLGDPEIVKPTKPATAQGKSENPAPPLPSLCCPTSQQIKLRIGKFKGRWVPWNRLFQVTREKPRHSSSLAWTPCAPLWNRPHSS